MMQPVQWAVGDTSTWLIDLVLDNNGVSDLTTSTSIQMAVYDSTKAFLRNSANNPTIVQNKPGIISWTPSGTDVGTAGTFYLRVVVNYGGTPKKFDRIEWDISA